MGRDEIMTTIPPKQQTPPDSILSLEQQLSYIQSLPEANDISIKVYDYIVVVYWNRFMGRQSNRVMHFVQENSKLATKEKIKILYVNTDNFFAGKK